MKPTIIFATTNENKVTEFEYLVQDTYIVQSLKKIGFKEEVPETSGTINGNAIQKAQFVFDKIGMPCVAEDTGLEVVALDNAPGVDTAHYAGEHRNAIDNMQLLLKNLEDKIDRSAQFKTVVAWCDEYGVKTFEGIVKGKIGMTMEGENGFGYDPIFVPDGFEKSFAVLDAEVKSKISHRSIAFSQFLDFIKSN
jgi:XTP/dITP diphosphohydrolase